MYNTHTELRVPIKYSRNPNMDLWGFARFQISGESEHLGVCGGLVLTSAGWDSALKGEEELGTGCLVSSSYTPPSAGDGFYCVHSVPAVYFSSWVTWMSIVAAAHVFQRMTKGRPQCPQLTSTILLLCLFRHKCYMLPSSFPFQPMSISRYLLKVFPSEIKTNQNQFLKFFSVTRISIL